MILRIVVPMLLLLISACAREPPEIVLSGPTMGTTYTVRIAAAPPTVNAVRVRMTIDEVLRLIDEQMSGYRDDSQLSRFNAQASTDWFAVSIEFAQLARAAASISEASNGALDITVAPLVRLWGFGPTHGQGEESGRPPDDAAIQGALERTGFRHLQVRVDPPALRKDIPELTIDLNAVAPGFAVDLLLDRLIAMGVRNCMIDIGGEIRVLGRNRKGERWRIAVEKPLAGEPTPHAILELSDLAVTTSGEYRRAVTREGRRYSHTIDPRTGRPVEHTLASVAVIAPTAMEADAWATALNVLGESGGYDLAVRLQMPALFIVERGGQFKSRATPELQPYLAVPPLH